MKLHFDRDTFSALLHLVSDNTDIRADVFEKDYYIRNNYVFNVAMAAASLAGARCA